MENPVQIAEHEQFGKIRFLIRDGKIWFFAADVCRALELVNVAQAVERLYDDEKCVLESYGKGYCQILPGGSAKKIYLVNEPGLYHLVFTSLAPGARKFQRWVYHEVLPSIRKTGSYSLVAKPAVNQNRRAGQLSDARVYVFEMSDGSVLIVKIGQSKNIRSRAAKLKRDTGLKIKNIYFTPFMSRENARLVEWACQEIFSSRRVNGEFFSVKFEEACKVIDSFAGMIAVPAIVSNYEGGGKIFKVAKKNIVELIADKKFD